MRPQNLGTSKCTTEGDTNVSIDYCDENGGFHDCTSLYVNNFIHKIGPFPSAMYNFLLSSSSHLVTRLNLQLHTLSVLFISTIFKQFNKGPFSIV